MVSFSPQFSFTCRRWWLPSIYALTLRIAADLFDELGEKKDVEVYSCDVSPDGSRLVTGGGGELLKLLAHLAQSLEAMLMSPARWTR